MCNIKNYNKFIFYSVIIKLLINEKMLLKKLHIFKLDIKYSFNIVYIVLIDKEHTQREYLKFIKNTHNM